jgi:hypothetical protein
MPTPDRATTESLTALLRAELGTGAAPDPARLAACDWGRFEALTTHHLLAPLVYKAVEGQRVPVPPHLLRRLRHAYHANRMRNAVVQSLVAELTSALAGAGVQSVLLKGAALVRTLYADPGVRHLRDIDLLVDERDLSRAGEQLAGIGFLPEGSAPRTRWPTCEFHLTYRRVDVRSIPLELHWRLFEEFLPYVFDLTEVRARAARAPGLADGVFTMGPAHELAYLCTHLERHGVVYPSLVGREDWLELLLLPQGKGRFLWLYDVALYLRRRAQAIDWDRFVGDARRWAIEGRVATVLELCGRAFHVVPPREVTLALEGRAAGLVERSAHRAVMTLNRAREGARRAASPSRRRLRRLGLLADRAIGWSHLWTSLFPPAAYLRARYSRQQGVGGLRVRHLRNMAPDVWRAIRRRTGRAAIGAPQRPLLRRLGRLRDLPPADRLLLVAAAGALPLIALGFRVARMRTVLGALGRMSGGRAEPAPEELPARIRRTRRLLTLAARHGLHRGTCLSRSTALWWLLRRQGIRADLRIGVSREGGKLEAHAWIEREGVVLNDRAEALRRYKPFLETLAS